ncbi:MAG: amylo-alpha-1,6-glucosidase [Kiritimatiellia bacterium]
MSRLQQHPPPGTRFVVHRGNTVEFTLTLDQPIPGSAWLRTNIGNAHAARSEIIANVERGEPILARDWTDIPLRRVTPQHYSTTLPLLEVGQWESKAFFLPHDSDQPLWPEGPNVIIKVEPALDCCVTSIYTAFVRQFGPNKTARPFPPDYDKMVRTLDVAGYTVIPRSGTFRNLIAELDFIIEELGFRIIQLLPPFPTPTTYGRMGPFGSPYGACDFFDVDPALAEFDRQTTPLEQFRELVTAVHRRHARIFIDIPINHTGWGSKLQNKHPEWFARNPDRTFKSPGAWGVTWEDLSMLDYHHRALWQYIAEVFLHWCRMGVDGFRCDAGYMIPWEVWQYIAARVREEYPDTIFLLEGLGGPAEVNQRLLTAANLDWAYSELFQNYDRNQIETYLPLAIRLSEQIGTQIHFAETHDNNRLAARSVAYARLRTALAALCSHHGGFGITNGVEWFATEKIDVHGAPSLNWGSEHNQVPALRRLNAILEVHPCFHAGTRLRLVQTGNFNAIALHRIQPQTGTAALVIANLDEARPGLASWNASIFPTDTRPVIDLLTGKEVEIQIHGPTASCLLEPCAIMCLSTDRTQLDQVEARLAEPPSLPSRALHQMLKATALDLYVKVTGSLDVSGIDCDALAKQLAADPVQFCANLRPGMPPPVVVWRWPVDSKRVVPVPADYSLCIIAEHAFSVRLCQGEKTLASARSLLSEDQRHFGFLMPIPPPDAPTRYTINLTVHEPDASRHVEAEVLYLPQWGKAAVRMLFSGAEARELDLYAICTNRLGTMSQVRGAWAELQSLYDCLLSANLDPDYPVERRILFTRCRMWLVRRGYSQAINGNSLDRFSLENNDSVKWEFSVPCGMGAFVRLSTQLRIGQSENSILLVFRRELRGGDPVQLDDHEPVFLILRPDVEDRACHDHTKAYTGPETLFRCSVRPRANGFSFAPSPDHALEIVVQNGKFVEEHEWLYMIRHPFEATRGIDDTSDLFSPGYFRIELKGGEQATMYARVTCQNWPRKEESHYDLLSSAETSIAGGVQSSLQAGVGTGKKPHQEYPFLEATRKAIQRFIVRRGKGLTILAGYPWFLDWGRDTLICLRGLIAAGMREETLAILSELARFESAGTLPNALRSNEVVNRDTSDAPLWLFVACADFLREYNDTRFLDLDCGGRPLIAVLHSIVRHYRQGTSTGVRMDAKSKLIFSPAHFTWMDTNHPAATPREGFPIEIQALWHAALSFMATLEPEKEWSSLAAEVEESILALYVRRQWGYLADCLHAASGSAAQQANADDALRPNQLLAITLGAVRKPLLCRDIVTACSELLVPGAIRSLADRPVVKPLPIMHRNQLLNDPYRPYRGRYEGHEDTQRKPAYHNGTAWTWLFPSWVEAFSMTYGPPARSAALSMLTASVELMNRGCVGHIPEIVDGDAPHELRGCGAQAWGATELYRVLNLLVGKPGQKTIAGSREKK